MRWTHFHRWRLTAHRQTRRYSLVHTDRGCARLPPDSPTGGPTFLTPALCADGWDPLEDAAREADRDPAEITRGLFQAVMFAETRE